MTELTETILCLLMFGAALLALASFFAGYWLGRWKETTRRGR